MKFYVETKKVGEAIKKAIRKKAKESDYILGSDVIEAFGKVPAKEMKEIHWKSSILLKKMRLRETKNGWFLYLPEPEKRSTLNSTLEDRGLNIVIFEEDEFNEMIENIIEKSVKTSCLNMSRCRVISKPTKNSIREEFGYTLPIPFQLDFMKSNDERVAFPVFVVVMDDGSVRQVKPENIIFEEIE